jgi:hypothetical protein
LNLSKQQKIELIALLEERNRRRAKEDCCYFINNYLMTFDPRPELTVHDLDFNLYPFQYDYVRTLIEHINSGTDLFDEKSRDMGASWLSLAVRFWMWLFRPGYQSLIGSRKEEYVDNRTIKSLLGKLEYFAKTIKDPLLLPEGFDLNKHRLHMKLINPANGNVIEGESSNANFSRAGRYTDILYDEIGFWPDARGSWAAGGDATRCRHAVTTPPDEPSYAKVLRHSGKIDVRTFHWRLHPNKDDDWYAYEKSRRTEEEVLHEIDISWEFSGVNRPYPEIKLSQVGRFGYNPDLPVYVSIDLGLDAVALGFYQAIPNSDFVCMIDAYESHGKIIDWYVPILGGSIDSQFQYTGDDLEFIEISRGWSSKVFYGDPSGKSSHIESDVSPYEILRDKYQIIVQTNDKENEWKPRRDAAKRILRRLKINDTPRTRWFIDCITNASYPKRDDESQSVQPISKPIHNWTSHHRTQLEFFAVNYRTKPIDAGVSAPYVERVSPFAQASSNTLDSLFPDEGADW